MVKADGSVSVHADDRAYKPLNWMTPPCTLTVYPIDMDDLEPVSADTPIVGVHEHGPTDGVASSTEELWVVENKKGEQLRITVHETISDTTYHLGDDPGLTKDGVEAHLQALLAQRPEVVGEGFTLVRREYPTPIGPVDILMRDPAGTTVAVEVKRRGGIDGVEQLTRYVELLNRDELLAPVTGVLAAQDVRPQARTLAEDRGFRCVIVDYDELRGTPSQELRLF